MLNAIALLAQTFPPPAPTPPPSPLEIAIMAAVFLVVIAILVFIYYLLYSALKAIPPEHRRMEPGQVWLLLIPVFNLVWNFFVFMRIPESYQSYFHSRGRTDVGDAGKNVGLWYSICACCAVIPCIGFIPGIASLILLILFLVKIMGLKAQVGQAAPGGFPVGYASPQPGMIPPPLPPSSSSPPPPPLP
ncbi:MAG: hypothetical protein WBD40_21100 [Tepidisphaeraceae bacterium]